MGALSGNVLVHGALRSDDTEATLDGLRTMGLLVTEDADGLRVGGVLRTATRPIDANESGTTLRLLTALAATLPSATQITGRPRLAERPMDPLIHALRSLGAKVERQITGFPVTVRGPLKGGRCRLPGDQSSQFVSGLLLAAPTANEAVHIDVAGPLSSRPYVDVTISMLREHGVTVEEGPHGFSVQPGQRVRQKPIQVAGDYSSAAFLLAAATVSSGEVTVEGLQPDDPQGDRRIVDFLAAFGASIERTGDTVTARGGPIGAVELDLGQTPDLFPVLAAVAACARGTSRLYGAPHLRGKESDRIRAMHENLRRFGIQSEEKPDGLVIHGGRPRAAQIASYRDHRIAMAGSVLALAADGPCDLPDPEVVTKSYPDFVRDFTSLTQGVTV